MVLSTILYYFFYLLTLPLRLFVYIKRTPARRLKQRSNARDYTRQRRTSEFGAYLPGRKYYDVRVDADLVLPIAKEGVGSQDARRIQDFFAQAIERHGDSAALMWQPEKDAPFKQWTWRQYYNDVKQAARAMIALELQPFESVNILGFNSPEWFIGNLGAIFAGGKSAGIYSTNDAAACKYITQHSEARLVIVEDEAQLHKYASIYTDLPRVTAIVIYRPPDAAWATRPHMGAIKLLTWDEFMALGGQLEGHEGASSPAASSTGGHSVIALEEELERRMERQSAGHCCTLIYTSGTTGPPKAVMISHDNLTWTARMIMEVIPGIGDSPEHWVSYLPLSHVAAQMLDIHGPVVAAATTRSPCTVWFARPDALRGSLKDTLLAARPTVFFGVPRVWEKFKEGMQAVKKTHLMTVVADWAKSVGTQKFRSDQLGSIEEPPLSFALANVIFKKVHAALGLDRCRYCISGAAPIAQDVLDYFGSLDLPIHQVYGMSECTGPATLDLPDCSKTGSCGHSLPGIEIKLEHVDGRDKAEEGEVCYRGRNIMMGYMKDEGKTQEAVDAEGWLHSGDVGRIDVNGFLYITGRIKELIITAGGENIAPVPIEDAIKGFLPAISNIMMVGDRRKFCTCLLTLKTLPDNDTGGFTDALCNEAKLVDPAAQTVAQAQVSPLWQTYIEAGIKRYNATAVSSAQRIQKFRILNEDFSIAAGDLTPTMKLKRSVVTEKLAPIIETMYDAE